jgi:polyhydroxyalkanoate synthesis regulator phasin
MGFLDKVKSAAQDVATEAKKATTTGKEKLEQVQIKKKMDNAAEQLGYLAYKGGTSGEEFDRLRSELAELESQLEAVGKDDDEGAAPPESPSDG